MKWDRFEAGGQVSESGEDHLKGRRRQSTNKVLRTSSATTVWEPTKTTQTREPKPVHLEFAAGKETVTSPVFSAWRRLKGWQGDK